MKEPIQIDVDIIEQDPSLLDAVISIEVDPVDTSIEIDDGEISSKMEDFGNDYETLVHKPKIEGVTLVGDKSLEDLNINMSRMGATLATDSQIDSLFDD